MTAVIAPVGVERERLEVVAAEARKLLLLEMLKGRVELASRGRRDDLADEGRPGETFIEYVPNAEDPDNPLTAGTVRVDPGSVTVRVVDQAVLDAWLGEHYPDKLIRQPAGTTARPVPSPGEDAALRAAWDFARAADIFQDGPANLWKVLQAAGYQLVRIEPTPERIIVDPEFWDALVKGVKANAKDAPPGELEMVADKMGLTVPGVTATKGKPKPVVTPSKDRAVVDAFAAAHRDEMMRAALPALEGTTA